MSTQNIGATVKVNGTMYRIVEIHGSNDLGTKFFGKARFILADSNGARFSAYGKRVAHNSRLTPVESPAPEAPARGILDGTGERGPVTVSGPSRPGNGTSTRWSRTIRGARYTFTAVAMPDGERRLFVTKYNGYGNDGTDEGIRSGMRFGCAWSPHREITIRPDAAGDVAAGEAPTGDPQGVTVADDAAQVAHEISSMEADGILPAPQVSKTPAPAPRAAYVPCAPGSIAAVITGSDVAGMRCVLCRALLTSHGDERYVHVDLDAAHGEALAEHAARCAAAALQAFNAQEWATARAIVARALGAGLADPIDVTWQLMLATIDAAQAKAESDTHPGEVHAAAVDQYGDNDAQRVTSDRPVDYTALSEIGAEALAVAYAHLAGSDESEASVIADAGTVAMEREARADIARERAVRAAAKRAEETHAIDVATEARYVLADSVTRGNFLNPRGIAEGVEPRSLFTGPEARVTAYASEELIEFFEGHGRMTVGDYRDAMRRERQDVTLTVGFDPADAPPADVADSAAGDVVDAGTADVPDVAGTVVGVTSGHSRSYAMNRPRVGPQLRPVRKALARALGRRGVTVHVTGGPACVVTVEAGTPDWGVIDQVVLATLGDMGALPVGELVGA